ncbi:MAG: ABC transporter permease [Candidatus Marinimicrobia bacterium]|nr:ABC transporter permease [Candidatus Neomarinimicrobiota bacterium]
MRQLITLIQKEFIQIFRNRTMLPIIFLMPLIQMAVLVFAATFDLKHIDVAVVDPKPTQSSRRIIASLQGNPLYSVNRYTGVTDAEKSFLSDENDLILVFPTHFEKKILHDGFEVQILVDAVDSRSAQLAVAYLQETLMNQIPGILMNVSGLSERSIQKARLHVIPRYLFNPELDYKQYMFPGLLVVLTSAVGIFLTAFNIVREKEVGTIEQVNVSPIHKTVFIVGKLIPFWIIAMFEMAFGLLIGHLFYNITVAGPLGDLFIFTGAYLLLGLGLGLLISTFAHTQQQVMFLSWFFMMIFILMSGIFTSTDSMPLWAQKANILNPMAHFMKVIRMIILKGSSLSDVIRPFLFIISYAFVVLLTAIIRYRKNEI